MKSKSTDKMERYNESKRLKEKYSEEKEVATQKPKNQKKTNK